MIEFMSGETFERNWLAIGLALEVLADRPRSRRRARLLAVYDARSTLIAEVLSTQYGPVVVARIAVTDGADRIRQDTKRGFLPLTDEPPDDRIVVTTRHGQYVLRAEELLGAIRDGTTTFVLGRTAPR
jgi:hypothetical protein